MYYALVRESLVRVMMNVNSRSRYVRYAHDGRQIRQSNGNAGLKYKCCALAYQRTE